VKVGWYGGGGSVGEEGGGGWGGDCEGLGGVGGQEEQGYCLLGCTHLDNVLLGPNVLRVVVCSLWCAVCDVRLAVFGWRCAFSGEQR